MFDLKVPHTRTFISGDWRPKCVRGEYVLSGIEMWEHQLRASKEREREREHAIACISLRERKTEYKILQERARLGVLAWARTTKIN
jgi:hypothetical protein